MKIIDIKDKNSLQNAAQVLKKGGVLIFPTDTVYGIGCALNKAAIRKLYKIKNRPATQPTAVLMSRNVFDGKRANELVLDLELDNKFFSGELTIIDHCRNYAIDFPRMITADNTIGIRLPQYDWLEKMIDEVGPIVASSANKKGERPPTNFSEISQPLIKQVDLVIRTDENLPGQPSQILDLETNKKIR